MLKVIQLKYMSLDKNRYVIDDWYHMPIPENVHIGKETWIHTAYAFSQYKSKRKIGVTIGHNCSIKDPLIQTGTNGEIKIGNYCTFVQPIINTNKKIIIGNNALVAYGVIISDSGYLIPPQKNTRVVKKNKISIRIGNNVWIGIKALILGGADIGDNSIIGAGAIVDFTVPKNSIVVGNPGRILPQKR